MTPHLHKQLPREHVSRVQLHYHRIIAPFRYQSRRPNDTGRQLNTSLNVNLVSVYEDFAGDGNPKTGS